MRSTAAVSSEAFEMDMPSAATASRICASLVVPHSGVMPCVCASAYNACSGEHLDSAAKLIIASCASSVGLPVNVQNDLKKV
jgi:hypothetical protein